MSARLEVTYTLPLHQEKVQGKQDQPTVLFSTYIHYAAEFLKTLQKCAYPLDRYLWFAKLAPVVMLTMMVDMTWPQVGFILFFFSETRRDERNTFIMNKKTSPQAFLIRFSDGSSLLFHPCFIFEEDWTRHHGTAADGTPVDSLDSFIVPGSEDIMFIRKEGKFLFTSLGELRELSRAIFGDTAASYGVTSGNTKVRNILSYEVTGSGDGGIIRKGWTSLEVSRAELEVLLRGLLRNAAEPVTGEGS